MRNKWIALIIIGAFIAPLISSADETSGGIDQLFATSKKKDIESGDIPMIEAALKKGYGKAILVNVNWKTFEKAKFVAAEELGATLQTLTQSLMERKGNEAFKADFNKKIKDISLENSSDAAVPAFSKKGSTLIVKGNFERMGWNRMEKGVGESIENAIKH